MSSRTRRDVDTKRRSTAQGRAYLDGQRARKLEIGPGQALCIPRGAVHRFDNTHATDASMLAVVTPGILGADYFKDVAAVITAAAGGSPSPAAIAEVMRQHGPTPAP